MTTVSAGQATRIGPGGSPTHRFPAQFRLLLTGLLLALIAMLIVDNHVMALPGGSFAEIGVARAVLDDPAGGVPAPQDAGAPARRSGSRSVHEMRHCFVQARRSGQDPATCRTGR